MSDPVEALLFDLDDTICEYRRPGSEILGLAFEEVGVDPMFTAQDYYAIFDEFVENSEDVVENRERCFAALTAEAGHGPTDGVAVAEVYEAKADQTNVRWLPGAHEALDTPREGYRVAAVTNGGPEMQRQKLRGLGVDDRFESVVFAATTWPPSRSRSTPHSTRWEGSGSGTTSSHRSDGRTTGRTLGLTPANPARTEQKQRVTRRRECCGVRKEGVTLFDGGDVVRVSNSEV